MSGQPRTIAAPGGLPHYGNFLRVNRLDISQEPQNGKPEAIGSLAIHSPHLINGIFPRIQTIDSFVQAGGMLAIFVRDNEMELGIPEDSVPLFWGVEASFEDDVTVDDKELILEIDSLDIGYPAFAASGIIKALNSKGQYRKTATINYRGGFYPIEAVDGPESFGRQPRISRKAITDHPVLTRRAGLELFKTGEIDRVDIGGIWMPSPEEKFFDHHKGRVAMPGVYSLGGLEHLLVASAFPEYDLTLDRVDARFYAPTIPGDMLELFARIHRVPNGLKVRAHTSISDVSKHPTATVFEFSQAA